MALESLGTRSKVTIAILVVAVALGGGVWAFSTDEQPETQQPETQQPDFDPAVETVDWLDLPDGYEAGVFADFEELGGQMREPHGGANPGVRFMHWRGEVLYAAVPGGASIYNSDDDSGRIVALEDPDHDGRADDFSVLLTGLNKPNNLDFYDDDMYVATKDSVLRYEMNGTDVVDGSKEELVTFREADAYDAPTVTVLANDRGLWVRRSTSIAYESVDSKFEAGIARCDLDGSNCTRYARGLRNAVGMTFSPDGSLVVSEMGAGHTLRDYPPDEINVVREGNHYGWPYCQADNEPIDSSFAELEGEKLENMAEMLRETDVDCSNMTAPAVELDAHMSPLGVTFYRGEGGMPDEFDGDLLVASHGSWGMDPPIGYEIARIDWDGNRSAVHDFVTGWKNETDYENPRGRPVDVTFGPGGAMYVTDDKEGRIFVVWHEDME